MFLLIDMSEKDQIHLAFFDINKRVDKTFEGRNRELLYCINVFLKECTKSDTTNPLPTSPYEGEESGQCVEGIMVVVGAGSFTNTRVACVVANTFAYARQIPLLAISIEQIENIQDLIPELLKQPKGQYISATYSGEPNIGKSNSL